MSGAGSIRIRMYRVGVGDCFLIRFPGPLHMVIDCGSVSAGAEASLALAVEDIGRETHGHVQVVVASHRRREHINGFESESKRWNTIAVDEVWMPWTEDPADEAAVALRERLDLIATLLENDDRDLTHQLAFNNTTSLAAFDTLLDGFAGHARRRFFVPRDEEVTCRVLPGVHARILGPVRNPTTLRRLEVESSFALSTVERPDRDRGPFGKSWHLRPEEARALFGPEIRERSPRSELDIAEQTTGELAFWLDKTVANSSLLLLLRFGRARLLLPGDAQWDSWLPVLGWEDLQAEIAKVDFYKVSQHGSHNGTPVRLRRHLGSPTSAVSTDARTWPGIPYAPLLGALAELGPVVRSDRPRGRVRKPWMDFEIPC